MRPIVSYDDITSQPPERLTNPPPPQPPAKKRKTSQNRCQGGSGHGGARAPPSVQHWDDPGNQGLHVNYNDTPATTSSVNLGRTNNMDVDENEEDYEEEEEESRELTHEEIWDDSALIDAWNSAAAEYEAYHGSGKKWKEEPVKKSPLSWYNVPPATTSKSKAKSKAPTVSKGTNMDQAHVDPAEYGTDSAPLNFDTFVPTHDPSLATATGSQVPAMSGVSGAGVGAEGSAVGQDEAFSRALTAMYWSGYWTAVYHCRRNESALQDGMEGKENMADDEHNRFDEGDEEDVDEELLPAQR